MVLLLPLACTPPTAQPPLPLTPPPSVWTGWKAITPYPCAVAMDGSVECWRDPSTGFELEHVDHPPLVDVIDLAQVQVRGLTADGLQVPVACQPIRIGTDLCSTAPARYQQLSAVGGLQLDGRLISSSSGRTIEFPPRDWSIASRRSIAAIDRHGSARYANYSGPVLFDFSPAGEPTAFVGTARAGTGFPPFACVLDSWGQVECQAQSAFPVDTFTNPPYQRLVGDRIFACAQRVVDHVIECSMGPDIDWGPLYDLDARAGESNRGQTMGTPDYDDADWWEPTVCAITMNNEVRCTGTHFTDALHDILDDVNAEHAWPETP